MTEPTFPRTFVAQRDEDVSGISGEGVIAEGVQFSDGWVVTHWLDQPPMHEPKTDVWHNKGSEPFERIHGHGGSTRLLWADEVAAARRKLTADIVEAFDVPAALLGTEGERAYLRQQLETAIQKVQDGEAAPVEVGDERIVAAAMPIVTALLEQRDRAQRAAGRAYQLADRWEAAHGSAMFLVRIAGAELRDALDGEPPAPSTSATEATEHTCTSACGGVTGIRGLLEHVGIDTSGRDITVAGSVVDAAEPQLRAVECSAQHHGFDFPRQCIRAAQHRGDHIDEQGYHWSDTVAVYPVSGGDPQEAASSRVGDWRPVPLATTCGSCPHRYDWHDARGVCQFGDETNRCGCATFTVGERPEPIDPTRILGAWAPADDGPRCVCGDPIQLSGDAAGWIHSPGSDTPCLDARPAPARCAQHPDAPIIGGLCGGCTQYPADMRTAPAAGEVQQ